jgi:AcrR family transcriptional regulator
LTAVQTFGGLAATPGASVSPAGTTGGAGDAPGKEQLFLIVLDRIMRRIVAGGRAAMAEHRDPIDQVSAIAMSAAKSLGSLGTTFRDAVLGSAPAMRIYSSYLSDSRDFIAALRQDAIDAGLIEPVHAVTIADTTIVIALHFVGPGAERSGDTPPKPSPRPTAC